MRRNRDDRLRSDHGTEGPKPRKQVVFSKTFKSIYSTHKHVALCIK